MHELVGQELDGPGLWVGIEWAEQQVDLSQRELKLDRTVNFWADQLD